MSNPKARVIVVDDHPLFRERLCQLINDEQDMEICGEAENAQPALQIIRDTPADLAIVDISLKTSSGLELVKNIRALSIGVPVLVLSMHDESLYAERALRAGAMGYITKSEEAAQVLLAVRSVLAGKIYLSQEMTLTFLKGLTTSGDRVSPHSVDRLTDRELQVLDLIGRGRTSKEIAEVLKLGLTTVDTYRARIKQKMNFRNAMELQLFAIRWLSERE
ncbi:MAG TPA: response regulator transcription factor [Chthoniobacterales bacterium]|nr:response regulator transcription factor [Chthoniobacterales bacterium]